MGFWTKREQTNIKRDVSGNVIAVEHKTDAQIEQERYEARMAAKSARYQEKEAQKQAEKIAYKNAFKTARIERRAKEGARQGGRLPMERVRYVVAGPPRQRPRVMVRQAPFGPQIYRLDAPVHHKKKGKQKAQTHKKHKEFDMIDNWGLWR
jgi:hypothetical protein